MIHELMIHQIGQMGPRGGQGNSLLWVVIVLLVLILVYLWYSNKKKHSTPVKNPIQMEKVDVAMKLLNENERRVIEAIVNNGGEILQKDIHYELDLTRVQAHRIVQGLAQRDLVTVEDHYNTKKVIISDWLVS